MGYRIVIGVMLLVCAGLFLYKQAAPKLQHLRRLKHEYVVNQKTQAQTRQKLKNCQAKKQKMQKQLTVLEQNSATLFLSRRHIQVFINAMLTSFKSDGLKVLLFQPQSNAKYLDLNIQLQGKVQNQIALLKAISQSKSRFKLLSLTFAMQTPPSLHLSLQYPLMPFGKLTQPFLKGVVLKSAQPRLIHFGWLQANNVKLNLYGSAENYFWSES